MAAFFFLVTLPILILAAAVGLGPAFLAFGIFAAGFAALMAAAVVVGCVFAFVKAFIEAVASSRKHGHPIFRRRA